jgi:hypothetical protein
MDPLSAAVAQALQQAPCSVRALAREAGVPHSSLVRIQAGQLRATTELAEAVAKGLRRWGDRCDRLAGAIEKAAKWPKGG